MKFRTSPNTSMAFPSCEAKTKFFSQVKKFFLFILKKKKTPKVFVAVAHDTYALLQTKLSTAFDCPKNFLNLCFQTSRQKGLLHAISYLNVLATTLSSGPLHASFVDVNFIFQKRVSANNFLQPGLQNCQERFTGENLTGVVVNVFQTTLANDVFPRRRSLNKRRKVSR